MVIFDKAAGNPLAVTRQFPFGWAYDISSNPPGPPKTGVLAALNEASQWLEIQDLCVSTDGAPRSTAPKLNALSVVQINTNVAVTSGEMSSRFSPIQKPHDIPHLESPIVDGNQ